VGRFVWNPEVVCTELEEGAVLLNMETRLYYSLNQSGLEIFRLLAASADESELVRHVADRFDVDEQGALAAVTGFLAQLGGERLVLADEGGTAGSPFAGATAAAETETEAGRRPFTQPELIKHDEPLHEVSTSPFDPQLPLAE
jgi:hypothetical protein